RPAYTPHRAEDLVVELPEPLIGIGVKAHRIAERLRIERPAFNVSRVPAEPHEVRQLRILLRQADLEVVPRLALVEEQRRLLPGEARRQVVSVEVKGAGPRPIRRAAVVASA